MSRLERQSNLLSRLGFLAVLRHPEHAVHGVPKLCHRLREKQPLLRSAVRSGKTLLELQPGVQILMNAFELSRPGRQRIRFRGVQHVAHRKRNGIEIVLDAQQL